MSLPLPKMYEPSRVSEIHLERAALAVEAGEAFARAHGVRPARADKVRVALFGIDVQIGFCTPGASLFVPGAVEDNQRAIEFLYRHLDRISALFFSMDTHTIFQIFHPMWWVDDEGRHPAPFTAITHDDVRLSRWRAVAHADESLEYTRKLEATGKYVLTIWPYHALLGGTSNALVPSVMEAAIFHGAARENPPVFETKGTHPLSENYSVLAPEVTELHGQSVGRFNEALFARLVEFDRVYVFGQAKSHCVLATLRDLAVHLRAIDPSLLGKIWILRDAMSPVPAPPLDPLPPGLDFPRLADEGLSELAAAGMHVVTTQDGLEV
jgi:nicotinamidase-related amidase